MPHTIKVNGDKPSKWPSRPEMNVDAHREPTVQPDWEQNDETAPDYIKNRPFSTKKTVLPITIYSDGIGRMSVEDSNDFFDNIASYIVRFDGEDYRFDMVPSVMYSGIQTYGVGGCFIPGNIGTILSGSEYPFAIFKEPISSQPSSTELREQIAIVQVIEPASDGKLPQVVKIETQKLSQEYLPVYPREVPEVTQDSSSKVPMAVWDYEAGKGRYELDYPIHVYAVTGTDARGYRLIDRETNEEISVGQVNFAGGPVVLTYNGVYLYQENTSSMEISFESVHRSYDIISNFTDGIPTDGYYYITLNRRYGSISVSRIPSSILPIKIVEKSNNGRVSFCRILTTNITLTSAESAYRRFRNFLVFNGEPFIAAELTENSITIVHMGKGEDGQYGVQKTTFGGITWKSETT